MQKCGLKAVSPLVAALILLAITVLGGILVYGVYQHYFNVYSRKLEVSVVACSMTKILDDRVLLSVDIKNTGTLTATSVTVTFYADSGSHVFNFGTLKPNEEASNSTLIKISEFPVQLYKDYPVEIFVIGEEDTFVKTISVPCLP